MDSESSSTQSTSQADNRRVLGQGAQLAEGGSTISQIDARANYQTDNSVSYTLDGEVANRAIDSAENVASKSLNFSSDVLGKGFDFGKLALSSVATGERQVLDSISQSNSMVKDAYADAKGRGAMTDKLTIAALAMAGIVAVMAVKGKA